MLEMALSMELVMGHWEWHWIGTLGMALGMKHWEWHWE